MARRRKDEIERECHRRGRRELRQQQVSLSRVPTVAKASRWSVTTRTAPLIINQPVAPRKPPITG